MVITMFTAKNAPPYFLARLTRANTISTTAIRPNIIDKYLKEISLLPIGIELVAEKNDKIRQITAIAIKK